MLLRAPFSYLNFPKIADNHSAGDEMKDDDEFPTTDDFTHIGHLVDSTDSEKNKRKKQSAINHLDYFLKNQDKYELKSHNDIKLSDITDDFVGKFATYLSKFARKKCDPSQPLLAYLTAHGYLSAFKMHYINRYKNEKEPPCFDRERWRKFMRAIYKDKSAQARESGQVCHLYCQINSFC